jgi:hypothetical protein
VGTVVERKTRYLVLGKMRGCTADAALEGFTRQMKRLPAVLRKSMTTLSWFASKPLPGSGWPATRNWRAA